jgi:signal transduction histidine kinase
MPEWVLQSHQQIHQTDPNSPGSPLRRFAMAALRGDSPLRAFVPVSMIILIVGMLVTSWWLSSQIESNVVQRTTQINALYIESFVAPLLNQVDSSQPLSAPEAKALDGILNNTPLGREIVAFIVWGPNGKVLYSSDASQIGKIYPVTDDLQGSLNGEVTWELNHHNDEGHIPSQHRADLLLATYTPIRHIGTNQIVAIAEFYQTGDPLVRDIQAAQRGAWIVVGLVTLAMLFVFIVFIRKASGTIARQQSELSTQVVQLTDLLGQNAELHERVQRATRRVAMLNEHFLRRVSSELHDGPAQYLSLALLHLDRADPGQDVASGTGDEHLQTVQQSVLQALQEVRSISSGLGLPQVEQLSLPDAIARAVRSHERRTRTSVDLICTNLPAQAPPDCKLTLYRVLQESLTNAFRHAGGAGQAVRVSLDDGMLVAEIIDQGPGLRPVSDGSDDHMGISGMRERVECLGGEFVIDSSPGVGTRIRARIPLFEKLDHAT